MKNQKIKPTKKKIVTYYLILAACLLVAAAITVGVIFGVTGNKKPTVDNPPIDVNPDKPDKPSKPDEPIKDTTTSYVFIVPIEETNVSLASVFCYDRTLDRYALHNAMDFSAKAGTKVLAAVDGTVTSVSKRDQLYGAVITIEHANGIETVYRFIDPVDNIKSGDKVNRGDVIGTVAVATGVENAEGDHLHFEVYENGERVDPDEYLNIISK